MEEDMWPNQFPVEDGVVPTDEVNQDQDFIHDDEVTQ